MAYQITGMSVSALSTVMDVTTNANHQLFTNPPAGYGLWCDGFPNPYRDGSGRTYLPIPHSENFRFRITDWDNPDSWVLDPPTLVSAREASEGRYNNRHWLFGHWANGDNVYALAHHEWYVEMVASGGVPGFNANNPPGTLFNQRWVNAITWASSSNGGSTFAVAPYNDSRRCVLIPEPWSNQSRNHMYGFFHPTNIVQEGAYYYAAVEQRSLGDMVTPENGGATGFCATTGMSLIRTTDLSSPLGWQFWNGSSWVTVNHATYQGNGSSQVPHRFFQTTNHNFYAEPNNFNSGMGHSIRYHSQSGLWVIFGFTGNTAGAKLGYTTSPTLANPQFTTITGVSGSSVADFDAPAGRYFSVFDPAATDQNFMNIGNTCMVLVQRDGVLVRRGTLTINVTSSGVEDRGLRVRNEANSAWIPASVSNLKMRNAANSGWLSLSALKMRDATNSVWLDVFAAPPAPTYAISPLAGSVNEGSSVTYSITTTGVGGGTLFWTNAGTTNGADFTDGLMSGSVSIVGDSGTITRTLTNDGLLEGGETIVLQLRTGSTGGPVVATASSVTVNDTSSSTPPPNPYTLTLARNDLDFIYAQDVAAAGDNVLTLNFTVNFNNYFAAGGDHIAFGINFELTDPHPVHCGPPITRNGQKLWTYGRGFFIRPGSNQVFAEFWNGTSSPPIELVSLIGGQGFNPATSPEVFVTVTGGFRSGSNANLMSIYIRKLTPEGSVVLLFYGTRPWGWDPAPIYKSAIAGIAAGFQSPNENGCVERTGAGIAPSATAIISNVSLTTA